MPRARPVKEDIVESWKDFLEHPHVALAQTAQPWVVFRGLANAEHGLYTSLLRAVRAAVDSSALSDRDEPPSQADVLGALPDLHTEL
jgi:hypothetical protein